MKVKLDENLAISHVNLLRKMGYDAERVNEEGLSGASDKKVWEHVLREDRFFVTLDIGFADIRRFPPGHHPGLLLIRPRTRSRNAVSFILKRILKEYPLENLKGCIVVADEHKTRIRR